MPRGERPLGPGDGVVVGFARDLRLLREKAGTPTYRELGARAHYSAAALSEAANGRKLPSLPVTIAYVAACGGDTVEWEARWRATAAESAAKAHVPGEGDGGRAPYVGLTAFQQEDADRFFGRAELVADLVRRLRNGRFLGVLGASGSGKSSLLRAGLVARLAAEREHDRAPIVVFTPGQHPFEECAVHLAGFLQQPPRTLSEEFSAEPRNLHLRIRQAMAACAADSDVVLVVDQFEEIFTLCHDPRERVSFIDALVMATSDPASRTRVVLGIRADFLGHCGEHPRLVAALRDTQVLVGAMTTDELRLAITGPAEQAGYRVETALVTRLVADATGQPGTLPLISHALLRTWLRRQGKVMTVAGYDAVGGIEHALTRSAEEIYQAFDAHQQSAAKQIFLRLTALGEGTEDTKRRVTRDELTPDDPSVAVALDTLARERLITLGDNSVEIAHEALIRHWPRLRDWLADDREGHRLRRQVTDATLEWEHHDRDDGLLYRGARLAAWQDRPLDQLNDAEHTFLTTSRHAVEREHRVRRRRVLWTIGGLSTATAIVAVLAVLAMMTASQAEHERTLAVSRQLIADIRAQLQVDPELGLLLAREAFTRIPDEDTEAVLRQATADSHLRATLPADPAGGPHLAVTGAAFSSDGKHVVIADSAGTLQVWDWDNSKVGRGMPRVLPGVYARGAVFSPDSDDIAVRGPGGVVLVRDWVRGGKPVTLAGRQGEVTAVAFSPDGRHLASGGADGTILVSSTTGDGQPVVLGTHDGEIVGVAYSADGRLLASSGQDGMVRVWDLAGGGTPVTLPDHQGRFGTVAFSPNGHVVSPDADGTIRTWDPASPARSVVLGNHAGGAQSVAFSSDGLWIASAGDNDVRVWNADHPAEPVVLRGHRGSIVAIAFSPDGKAVISASMDGTAKVWDIDEIEDVTVLRGHQGPVSSAVPSPDGRRVASGGQDGTVRLWDIPGDSDPVTLPGTGQPVRELAFSPNSRYLAAVNDDGTVLVWNTQNPTEPLQPRSSSPSALGAAFSPDSTRLATANGDYLEIWTIPKNGQDSQPSSERLPSGQEVLHEVAWSPDGRHLAAATGSNSVVVWDLRTRDKFFTVLPGNQSDIDMITFSPDGTDLASADNNGVHLWNLTSTANPTVLRSHHDVVRNVIFSPDGRHVITSGNDTISIWRTDSTNEPLVLDGFRASVNSIASVTNDRYVTAHDDGTIRIWRCSVCGPITQVLAQANQHITRELTPQERRTYLPGNP